MNIGQDISKKIEEKLPEAVGTTLKERLEQAEKAEKKVQKLEDKLKEAKTELEGWYDLEEKMDEREKNLNVRESKLIDREQEIEKKEEEHIIHDKELELAETRVRDMKDVVGMVFANNKYKYQKTIDKPVPRRNQDGSEWVGNEVQTETVEVEE